MSRARELTWVAAGGAIGTLLRYGLDEGLGTVGDLPASTLLVNLVGALALGLLLGTAVSDRRRLLLGTGLLGGFTTYSAFAVQTHGLVDANGIALAVAYPIATVVGGFALSILGLRWARR